MFTIKNDTMKKIFLLLAVAAGSLSVKSQAQTATYPYQFNYSADNTYTPLGSGASEIVGATGWDDETFPFTLPFNFYFTGNLVQSWVLDTYGGLYPVGANDNIDVPPILGFFSDYIDRGNSWIGYQVTGATGSRIAKIEFRSVGYFADESGADSANFQIWLYEGSNKIEYHAGPSLVAADRFDPANESGDIILTGLVYTNNSENAPPADDDTFHFVGRINNTPKDSIVVINSVSGPSDPNLMGFINYGIFPPNGAVFTFTPPGTPPPTSIGDVAAGTKSRVYPNPVQDRLTLSLDKAPEKGSSFVIFDIAGREMIRVPVTQQSTVVPVSSLGSGIYMGTLFANGRKETLRIVKK